MMKTKRFSLIARQMAFVFVLLVGCGSSDPARDKLMNVPGNSAQMPSWEATKLSETGMPDIAPETYVAAGRMHESQGRLTRAAAQYRMAIQLDPKHVEAHNRLGLVLCQMQQFKEADAVLAKAIELAPDRPHLHNNRGFSYLIQMRWTEAEQSFRKALELQPDFARAHVNLGMVLAQQGRFDEAMRHFLIVVPAEDAWFNIGLMYQSKSRPAEAARAFKTALKCNAKMAAAQQCLNKLPQEISSSAKPFDNLTALAVTPKANSLPEQPQPPAEAVVVAATQPETDSRPPTVQSAHEDIRTAAESADLTFEEPFEPTSELLETAQMPQSEPSMPIQESLAFDQVPQTEALAEVIEPTPDTSPAPQEEESIRGGPLDPQILAALMNSEPFNVNDNLPEVDPFVESSEQENEEVEPATEETPAVAERVETAAPAMANTTSQPTSITYDLLGGQDANDLFALNWMSKNSADEQFEIVLSVPPPLPPAARNAVLISTRPAAEAPTPEELRTVIEALLQLSHSPTDAMPKPYSGPTSTRSAAGTPQSQPAAGREQALGQPDMTAETNVPEQDEIWRRPLWDDLEAFGPEEPSGSTTSDD
ncbi:MAG: tetratricopeptide repeat protein [Phycisphaerae bacterium]